MSGGAKRAAGKEDCAYDGAAVIDNFTASLSRGEKVALVGRNGAGKTTLLRSLVRSAPGPIDEADRFSHRFIPSDGRL